MTAPDDSARFASDRGANAKCPYPWCTTDHGRTAHPDDEHHRSIGVAVEVFLRSTGRPATEYWTTIEVGLYRRVSDDETWVTFDDAGSVRLDVSLETFRDAIARLGLDPLALDEMRPR